MRNKPAFTMEERTEQPTRSEQAAFGLPAHAGVNDAWVEIEIGDGWRAAFRLAPYGGQPVIAELRVFPADQYPGRKPGTWRGDVLGVQAGGAQRVRKVLPGGKTVDCPPVRTGITARLLRRIPLGEHRRHAETFIARLKETHRGMGADLAAWGFNAEIEKGKKKPTVQRRGGRPDRFYADLAAAYVARIAAGSRRPVADLADRRKLSASVVRDAIHEARVRGLLMKGRQGAPGGTLTAKAEAILKGKRVTR
jgi:hypothetical protein